MRNKARTALGHPVHESVMIDWDVGLHGIIATINSPVAIQRYQKMDE